jgi:predicted acyl esterase
MWHIPQAAEKTELGQNSAVVRAQIDFVWGVRIPMRDGVNLNATLYMPKGVPEAPAILP